MTWKEKLRCNFDILRINTIFFMVRIINFQQKYNYIVFLCENIAYLSITYFFANIIDWNNIMPKFTKKLKKLGGSGNFILLCEFFFNYILLMCCMDSIQNCWDWDIKTICLIFPGTHTTLLRTSYRLSKRYTFSFWIFFLRVLGFLY